MSSREQFEAWFENDVVDKKVTFPAFEDGEYTEGDLYDDQLYFMLQAMWMAWQAASKASEQQLAAVVAENAGLKNSLEWLYETVSSDGVSVPDEKYSSVTKAAQVLSETPATDAYLGEVRAQGVEMFASSLKVLGQHEHPYSTAAKEFAAQLRQGAAL